jgi:hypothetical protein
MRVLFAAGLLFSGAVFADETSVKGITLGRPLPPDVKAEIQRAKGIYKTTYMGMPVSMVILLDHEKVINVSFAVPTNSVEALTAELTKRYGPVDSTVPDAPSWYTTDAEIFFSLPSRSDQKPQLFFVHQPRPTPVKLDPKDS